MGGDRTCPDDCPLAVWAGLSKTDRKAQRKSVAERLYRQGLTMEQIATQLGVSHMTIVRDLREFEHNVQIKPAKTERNPKGAGRPKGKKTAKRAPRKEGEKQAQRSVNARPEDWDQFKAKAIAEGKTAAQKLGELVAEPVIDPTSLSMTAQQKLDIALRQQKNRNDAIFEQRVRGEVVRRVDEIMLPLWKERIEEAKNLYVGRRGIMDKVTYNLIWGCLHPDSRLSTSPERLAKAFNAFESFEKRLLAEKDSPTNMPDIPDNLAAWDKMKAEAQKSRRANRNAVKRR